MKNNFGPLEKTPDNSTLFDFLSGYFINLAVAQIKFTQMIVSLQEKNYLH